MSFDLSSLLDNWEYQHGQVQVRRFVGDDGVQKLQLRLDLGILQMNVTGRPDGKRPHDRESLLDHYRSLLHSHREQNQGDDETFVLDAEDCAKLQQEAVQYHHRELCFFQLEDFEAVLRDTQRNLDLFDLVDEFAETDELAWSLQQFRPQCLMMQIRARAALALKEENHDEAIACIRTGLEDLRNFYQEVNREDLLEQSSEVRSLESWLETVESTRPLPDRERLQRALQEAVRREDYEKAAQYRDALRKLETNC
jgi:tetratricopeptide (TPR) repeat protein